MRVFSFMMKSGDVRPLADRIKQEGHRATLHEEGEVPEYPRPDCIVAEFGRGKEADELRKKDYPVFGASAFGDRIELDSLYGYQIMRMNKIEILEDKIKGHKIETELWFNGEAPIGVFHRIVDNHLCDNNIGPQINMGYIMWEGSVQDELYKKGLGNIEDMLRELGYKGCIRLQYVVHKGKLYGTTFNTHTDLSALSELYIGRLNDFLYGVSSGVLKKLYVKQGWAMALSLVLLTNEIYRDMDVHGFNKYNRKHAWLYSITGGKLTTPGGLIATITSRGDFIREARRRVYRTVRNLKIQDLIYRTDVGRNVSQVFTELFEQGWISGKKEVGNDRFSKKADPKEHCRDNGASWSVDSTTAGVGHDSTKDNSGVHTEDTEPNSTSGSNV